MVEAVDGVAGVLEPEAGVKSDVSGDRDEDRDWDAALEEPGDTPSNLAWSRRASDTSRSILPLLLVCA